MAEFELELFALYRILIRIHSCKIPHLLQPNNVPYCCCQSVNRLLFYASPLQSLCSESSLEQLHGNTFRLKIYGKGGRGGGG